MTTLTVDTLAMRGRKIGAPSKYPAMRETVKTHIQSKLPESEGLFVNYGFPFSPLPYTMQDSYSGKEENLIFKRITLENRHLRAEFLPEVGGRLWRLYDKDRKCELLWTNTEFLPCNLAIRNAWVAGGIEYNFGRRGHDAQSSDSRFAAEVMAGDGTPVLRFYEMNRDRTIPFQLDFHLPDDSKFLFARVRMENPHNHTTPMYYWANIALPEISGCRVVTPAAEAYINAYNEGRHVLTKTSLPGGEGFDATFPASFKNVKDHFYNIPDNARKIETVVYPDGKTFVFASTKRLQGRKLFAWGQNPGGRHWQEKLAGAGMPPYIEIQGGLAKTQMECLPMPPSTVWEHVEAYGGCDLKYSDFSGEWTNARENMSSVMDSVIPEAVLENELAEGAGSYALRRGKILHSGSGWGALELARRRAAGLPAFAPHLDFGAPGPLQADWLHFLNGGPAPDNGTYMVQDEYFTKMGTGIHRALNLFYRGEFDAAAGCAADLENALAKYILAEIEYARGFHKRAAGLIAEAACADPDEFLAKEAMKLILEAGEPELAERVYRIFPEYIANGAMMRFLYASALARSGKAEEAETIMNGLPEIPDIREGENSVSGLYIHVRKLNGAKEEDIKVPFKFDLRMVQ